MPETHGVAKSDTDERRTEPNWLGLSLLQPLAISVSFEVLVLLSVLRSWCS